MSRVSVIGVAPLPAAGPASVSPHQHRDTTAAAGAERLPLCRAHCRCGTSEREARRKLSSASPRRRHRGVITRTGVRKTIILPQASHVRYQQPGQLGIPGLARRTYCPPPRSLPQASASHRVGIAGSNGAAHAANWLDALLQVMDVQTGCRGMLRRVTTARRKIGKNICASRRSEPGSGPQALRWTAHESTVTGSGNRWFCDGWLWLLQANQWTADPELRILQDVSPTSCPSTGQDGHGGFRCCRQ